MNENVLKEEIAMLENQIRILQQENQKYKEVIDKAIELLNNHTILLPTEYSDEVANFKRNLINILKEVEQMSEEELNINYIREKTGLVENDELIPIILEMIKESYKAGLCQSEFDNTMDLIEQNQELSKQNNILQADKEQLNSLVNSCQEEIRRLKKQLEEKNNPQIFIDTQDMEERYAEGLYQEYLEEENIKYKNQQKEFIEYLEDLIKQNETVVEVSKYGLPKNCSKLLIDFYKEILSKYKEIIGGK